MSDKRFFSFLKSDEQKAVEGVLAEFKNICAVTRAHLEMVGKWFEDKGVKVGLAWTQDTIDVAEKFHSALIAEEARELTLTLAKPAIPPQGLPVSTTPAASAVTGPSKAIFADPEVEPLPVVSP